MLYILGIEFARNEFDMQKKLYSFGGHLIELTIFQPYQCYVFELTAK